MAIHFCLFAEKQRIDPQIPAVPKSPPAQSIAPAGASRGPQGGSALTRLAAFFMPFQAVAVKLLLLDH
jgi:hypothetical protein